MRHLIKYMVSFALTLIVVLPIQAQTESQAFYIYQNDGHFDGFFYDEIEKMSFSFLDTLGVEHDEIVSQEIVTADSTYRIMLSAIDSIGFVQPPIELNGGIRNMREEGMTDYIASIDDESLIIVFYGDMPINLRPKVGETLVDFDLEQGFGGKVASVKDVDGEIIVQCDPLTSLKDVFRRFVCVEEYGHNSQGELVRRRVAGMPQLTRGKWNKAKKASEDFDFSLFDINFGGHLPVGIEGQITMTFDINAHVATTLKGSYNINYIDPIYIGLLFTSDVSFGLGVTIDGKLANLIDFSTDFIPGLPIPAAAPIFEIRNIPGLFARGEAHMKFTAGLVDVPLSQVWHKLEFNDDWIPSFTYGNNPGASKPEQKIQDGTPPLDTYLEFNGFLQAGVHAPLTLSTNRWLSKICKAEFGTHLYIGPKLTGNIRINFADMMKDGPSLYDALKNSALALTPLSIDFETKAKMSGWWGNNKEVTFGDGSVKVWEDRSLYLLPQFGNWQKFTDPKTGDEYAAIMCENKATIIPYPVGIRCYSVREGGRLQKHDDYADQQICQLGARWLGSADPMDHPYVNLEILGNGSFVLRPIYKFGNMLLEGSPEFTYESGIQLSRDTMYVDWDGKCLTPITVKGDFDEIRDSDTEPENPFYSMEIVGNTFKCNSKRKNYCLIDSIVPSILRIIAVKKKANGEEKTYLSDIITIIQLPYKDAGVPNFYDATRFGDYEKRTLKPLSGSREGNVFKVKASDSRTVFDEENNYKMEISWEFSAVFEVCKSTYYNEEDSIEIRDGNYKKTIKVYSKYDNSYYLATVYTEKIPNLNSLVPNHPDGNYDSIGSWTSYGLATFAGYSDTATWSSKNYDADGKLMNEDSGVFGNSKRFEWAFYYSDYSDQ